MCTQKLWRALGNPGQPPVQAVTPLPTGTLLGSWGLKLFHYNRKGFVLALNERTYLTLVFPAAPRAAFRERFAEALTAALVDLGVAEGTAQQEAMVLDFLPVARLTNRRLTGSLNDLEFLAFCELDYISDLRKVQLNLNEVPHVKRDPSCPIDAVVRLFGSLKGQMSFTRIH
ncbi:MAG TPA: hypothetical protein VN700_06245 [Vicinamibacterales bacterium]|nr:hypothetical protein [Vicinamibacterales bacterium]